MSLFEFQELDSFGDERSGVEIQNTCEGGTTTAFGTSTCRLCKSVRETNAHGSDQGCYSGHCVTVPGGTLAQDKYSRSLLKLACICMLKYPSQNYGPKHRDLSIEGHPSISAEYTKNKLEGEPCGNRDTVSNSWNGFSNSCMGYIKGSQGPATVTRGSRTGTWRDKEFERVRIQQHRLQNKASQRRDGAQQGRKAMEATEAPIFEHSTGTQGKNFAGTLKDTATL